MSLTLSGTDGIVGAGFTLDASGASVTAGVGTFGSLNAPAAGLTGALPAISAANCTNIPAANITGTLPAISGANLTGLTAGITMCDTWVVTTSFNEQTDFITSNWSRQQTPATHYGGFGSAMTESSGVFTFPSNGHYYVESTISGYANSGARSYVGNVHYISTNSGGAYSEVVKGYTSGYADSAHWSITISDIYDVTDYSATRWKLKLESNGLNNIFGSTSGNIGLTGVRFIRLGDT